MNGHGLTLLGTYWRKQQKTFLHLWVDEGERILLQIAADSNADKQKINSNEQITHHPCRVLMTESKPAEYCLRLCALTLSGFVSDSVATR